MFIFYFAELPAEEGMYYAFELHFHIYCKHQEMSILL